MKELMIHVERIVRPLRASQPRKLRMRRELLAHLTAALEEERGRCPDEAGAMVAAKRRLGEPAALARQLEQSVPRVERLLYTRIQSLDWLESHQVNRLQLVMGDSNRVDMMGASKAMLLMSISGVLSLAAFALSAVFFYNPMTLALGPDHPTSWILGWLTGVTILMIWIWLCLQFACEMAGLAKSWRLGHAVGYYTAIIALLTLWTCIAAVMFDHHITLLDIGRSVAFALMLVLALTLLGRILGSLPRPYEEWLTLNIAD